MDDVVDRVVAEFIRRSVRQAALDPAAAQEHRIAFHVMVAAGAALVALGHRRAAEFTAPGDECVLEHSPLLQVLDQGRRGAVHVRGILPDEFDEIVVMVPIAVVELDEANPAFGEATREQAI